MNPQLQTMHELSVAMNIVEIAEEERERHHAVRVHAIHLRLGPLSGVSKEALLFSYPFACEGTSLEGSRLAIHEEGAGEALEIIGLEVE